MTDYTFIKDPSLLEEDHRVEDLLDFSANINDLTEQLVRIKNNSIVGLIGPYGCGKSTLLYQIYKDEGGANENVNAENIAQVRNAKWFTFDAWKYPERKDLWDGFVIDVAMQMSTNILAKVKAEIDGNKNSAAKTAVKLGSAVVKTVAAVKMVPGVGYLTDAVEDILGNTLSSPPIKRVYEFQGLLKKLLNNIKEDIYIVVEDIDRSGDQGIFFLETLRHFIKNIESEHKIIVIVPMGEEVFQKQDNNMARDSYLKVLDYQVKFDPQDIKFDKFIDSVMDIDEFVKPRLDEMSSQEEKDNYLAIFHQFVGRFFSRKILEDERGNIRDVKHLIRTADKKYSIMQTSDADKVEPMLVLLFTATEYFHSKNGEAEKYWLQVAGTRSYGSKIIHGEGHSIMNSNYWIYRELCVYLEGIPQNSMAHYYNQTDQQLPRVYVSFVALQVKSHLGEVNIGEVEISSSGSQDKAKAILLNNKYLDIITEKLIREFVIKKDQS